MDEDLSESEPCARDDESFEPGVLIEDWGDRIAIWLRGYSMRYEVRGGTHAVRTSTERLYEGRHRRDARHQRSAERHANQTVARWLESHPRIVH